MNCSRPKRKLMKSSKMPKKKGTVAFIFHPEASFLLVISLRQRKLKEAREAAEHEVNKYRHEKQAEFDKMKAEV